MVERGETSHGITTVKERNTEADMAEKQVLEFTLNDEQYCTDIGYVSEIVRRSEDDVTSVPNASRHMEGVMDLRGDTTKIIDPRTVLSLGKSDEYDHDTIIVFEDDGPADDDIGWAVNDVTRVTSIDTENVEQTEDERIDGIVNRDDGFVVWTSPDTITATA